MCLKYILPIDKEVKFHFPERCKNDILTSAILAAH